MVTSNTAYTRTEKNHESLMHVSFSAEKILFVHMYKQTYIYIYKHIHTRMCVHTSHL